jgi:YD repeat-containing protein
MPDRNDIPLGYVYDPLGNVLTYKESGGYWSEYTRDSNGNELSYKDSNGYWCEYTRDDAGSVLTYKDSEGNRLPSPRTAMLNP